MVGTSFHPQDVSLGRLTEYYLNQLRQGNHLSIDDLVAAFPHLAHDIRATIPALTLLEKTISGGSGGNFGQQPLTLGGCQIVEPIGAGAMGVVYKAHQKEMNRTVAIKVITLSADALASNADRFQIERQAMARIDHPNIVPAYYYGHEGRFAYLVMKYINGISLERTLSPNADYRAQALLAEIRGDWRFFTKMAARVASGLQHIHDLGLVHRDIKPANLLLDTKQHVWITDFGLAKVVDLAQSLSHTGDAIGTPRYMAPEQLRGICDARSDIYSLGITLYELAGRCRAWSEHSGQGHAARRSSLELPNLREVNPEVPEELAKIIMKSCAFSPDDRYQTCQELEYVLLRFAEGLPKGDRRGRHREPDEIFRRKRRRLQIAVAGVGAGTFIAGLVLYPWMTRDRAPENPPVVAAAPSPAATPTPTPTPTQTPPAAKPTRKTAAFVKNLADPGSGNLTELIQGVVSESVQEAGDQFHLTEDEKRQVAEQLDQFMKTIEHQINTQYPHGKSSAFIENYRQSSITTATRVMTLVPVVERSGLTLEEKQQAYATLRQFAKLVLNRKLDAAYAESALTSINYGKPPSLEDLEQLAISDRSLRTWVAHIRTVNNAVPNASPNEEIEIGQELQQMLDAAIQQQLQQSAAPAPTPSAGR